MDSMSTKQVHLGKRPNERTSRQGKGSLVWMVRRRVDFDNADACIIYADGGGDFGEKYAFDRKVKGGMSIMFMHYGVHQQRNCGKILSYGLGVFMMMIFPSIHHGLLIFEREKPSGWSRCQKLTAFDEFYWNLNFPKIAIIVTPYHSHPDRAKHDTLWQFEILE